MTTHQPIPPSERVPAPTIAFEPAKLRRRYDGWTAEKQIRFVEALAATKCVDEACRIVGMSDTSAYTLRNRPCGEVCSGVGYRARLPDTGSRAGRHEPRPLRSPPPHLLQGRAGRRVSPFRRAPDHVPAAQPAPEALRKWLEQAPEARHAAALFPHPRRPLPRRKSNFR